MNGSCCAILAIFVMCSVSFNVVESSVNGGVSCAACSALVAIAEQLSELNNQTIAHTLSEICNVFPLPVQSYCTLAIDYLSPFLLKVIVDKNGPDVVCHALDFCHTDPGQKTCKSMGYRTPSKLPFDVQVARAKMLLNSLPEKKPFSRDICDLPGIKQICNLIKRPFDDRKPAVDFDADGFSTVEALRGSFWRGRDCSDLSASVHPGALPEHHDRVFDSNCNGIYGVNLHTGKSYEDELCAGTEQRGLAVLGDSISAHFSLPSAWLDATKLSLKAFKPLLTVLENEFDWPMLSTITGHLNNTWQEVIKGPMESIYHKMFKRNRCMHRDFQNIAVNGAQSHNMHKYMSTLSRVQGKDHPLVVALALVGNDICAGARETLAGMTTPTEMFDNTMETLRYLDKHLPNNSNVMIFSLVDGRILYDKMNARTHPIGTYWNKFTYSQFYDFLNCLDLDTTHGNWEYLWLYGPYCLMLSPCPGWLTSNDTVRDLTYKRVLELNFALREVVTLHKDSFQNFKLYYLDTPIEEVFEEWEKQGGQAWQLIDATDGFHTSQYGQSMTAEAIWKISNEKYPEVFGPVNPNNDRIKELFGDQGGF